MDHSNFARWTIPYFELRECLHSVSWNSQHFIYIFKRFRPWSEGPYRSPLIWIWTVWKNDTDSLQRGTGVERKDSSFVFVVVVVVVVVVSSIQWTIMIFSVCAFLESKWDIGFCTWATQTRKLVILVHPLRSTLNLGLANSWTGYMWIATVYVFIWNSWYYANFSHHQYYPLYSMTRASPLL